MSDPLPIGALRDRLLTSANAARDAADLAEAALDLIRPHVCTRCAGYGTVFRDHLTTSRRECSRCKGTGWNKE